MMKKLLGIVVLGLLLSGNAYADIWQGLKDINKFNLDLNVSISEAGKNCNVESYDIERNIKYLIGNSRIKLSDESNLEKLYISVMIKGGGDVACSASITFLTFHWGTINNKSGVSFTGLKGSYFQEAITLSMPSEFRTVFLNQVDDLMKNFIIEWNEVNTQ